MTRPRGRQKRGNAERQFDAKVGRRIRDIRLRREITLQSLADAMGCTVGALSNYELGKAHVHPVTLQRIAGVLGCSASDFFEGAMS